MSPHVRPPELKDARCSITYSLREKNENKFAPSPQTVPAVLSLNEM